MIVDDDPHFTATLRYNLEKAGYRVIARSHAKWAIRHIARQRPNILLLDWDLPSLSGIDLCARIRACIEFEDVPIIMLTARDSKDDKIRALNNGADDYLTKPFAIAELLARMRAAVRRAKTTLQDETILSYGDLSIDRGTQRVTRAGYTIDLASIEYRILLLLMKRPGWMLSREQLINSIWNHDDPIDVRTADAHVRTLRASLNDHGPDIIQSVRSDGYALAKPMDLESGSLENSSSLNIAYGRS